MYEITHIIDYIKFLKNECHLSLSIHIREKDNIIYNSPLKSMNVHENSYCSLIKALPNGLSKCVKQQGKVMQKCKFGSFCGLCYAGVREYVYPITNGIKPIGFISVSGYRIDNMESYINRLSTIFPITKENLTTASLALTTDIPSKKHIDTLITPLCNMIELACIRSRKTTNSNNACTINQVIEYVDEHYKEDLKIDNLCKIFSCSNSYFSHAFKKETGKNFREYLTELRLEDAKYLLKYSQLNVTQISVSLGFLDSNYFSNVFKKNVGITPMEYRQIHIKTEE